MSLSCGRRSEIIFTVRLGKLPCVGESLDAGLECPAGQPQVTVAWREHSREAGWVSPGTGLSSEGPLCPGHLSSGSPLSATYLTQELTSSPANVLFQRKVQERTFQTVGK